MKIVIITLAGCNWGASEFLWEKAAKSSVNNGDEVIVSCCKCFSQNPEIKELERNNIKIHTRLNDNSLLKRIIDKAFDIPFFTNIFIFLNYHSIFKKKPDLVLINEPAVFSIIRFKFLCKYFIEKNTPYVLVSHGSQDVGSILSYDSIKIARNILKLAVAVFFVSNRSIEAIQRQLAFKLSNAYLARNPVNMDSTEYIPFPETSFPNLACVARLACDDKGQDILIETLSSPKWKCRKWILNLYGDGTDKKYLEELIIVYGLEKKVKLRGYHEVRSIWKNNQLLVLPSIAEGTPISMVEAMLCGRPAVVTDVAGMPEWIIDNVNGFIAEAPKKKYLDKALERAWNTYPDWEKLGKKARETAIKYYKENPGQALLDEIKKILSSI